MLPPCKDLPEVSQEGEQPSPATPCRKREFIAICIVENISMDRTDGSPKSLVWLVADSNPVKWQKHLAVPLDRRFPTPHNIWTPIAYVIQRRLFRECRIRLADNFYVRNAVEDPADKGNKERLDEEIAIFRGLMGGNNQPLFVLCFGQFAFEFVRRARQEVPQLDFRDWTVPRLAKEFRDRICAFRVDEVNVLPLLHKVVAQRFIQCHREFSGDNDDYKNNYFEYVGEQIAGALIEHRTNPKLDRLWDKAGSAGLETEPARIPISANVQL